MDIEFDIPDEAQTSQLQQADVVRRHFKSRHMSKKYTGPWISGVSRKTLKAKVVKHYKAYHAIENMGLAEQDRLMVEWATALIEDLYPAAVHDTPSAGS